MPEESYDLVIRGRRVLTTAGIAPREVGVRGGKVMALEPLGSGLSGAEVIELADDETLLPGLVDTHVHVNEPGRTEWEGFASATRAAAAGGVTTIIDMPLNSIPPTTTVDALNLKREAAKDQAFVDVGFWGGAIPGNKADLRPLHDEGVFGFKCFLLHSGVDEFPHLDAEELEEDLAELKSFDALMIVHAEDAHAIDRAPHPGGNQYATFLASRPRGAENKAIAEVIERARWTGARVHILHLSSSDALPMIASAKRDGVHLTVETCPHYLTLTAEEIPTGATAYKCCPPIREASNRELLWKGLQDGTIDCIVSDHSPSTLELKDLEHGDFAVAWGGVSSLQLGLSLVWTEARHRGIPLEQVVSWMAQKPAELARLGNKGQLALGYDADFAVFAQDEACVVDVAKLKHKNPVTPYDGKELSGVVRRTFLRGQEVDGRAPRGRLLRRTPAVKLQPGTPAPEFTLPDAAGRKVSLADYRGKNVIVHFYPKAAIPGCTTEACDFRDNLASLQGSGYEVLGISPDAPEALAQFTLDFAPAFPLLTDEDHSVAQAYGAWGEKLVRGEVTEGLIRSTVVVDPEGRVRLARYQVAAQGHVAALKDALGI